MEKGLIIKSTGSWYTVKLENGQTVNCTIKGKFRKEGIKSTNLVAVGDRVEVALLENEGVGIIQDYFERKNHIVRKATNLSKTSHIIAANVDQALLVITLANPKTTTLFIDRFLVSAESYRIPTILIINKMDLIEGKLAGELEILESDYQKAGYPIVKTSIVSQANLGEVKKTLEGKVSVVAGNSGVGKSSLINAIDSAINLKVGEISHYHKSGKHTTTFAEMHELSFGGYIIDTPGIKAFGLVDMGKDEIYHFFPEIFKHSKNCGFYNCLHVSEPKCAVKRAVQDGVIGISRYNNYLAIYFSDEGKYR